MLRKIRIALAAVFFVGITLLLIGVKQEWFGWMARMQFLPSCLALNFAVIVGILLLVFVFGRIYCSVICPLGVFQDLIIKLRPKKKKFQYNPERGIIRVLITALVIASAIVFGQLIISLLAPYSAYGRIISSIVGVIEGGKALALVVVGLITFLGIGLSAYLWGRAYCNTICPVGTIFGLISRYSLFRPVIDKEKCVHCGSCYRKCKSSCIDGENREIDGSRCVVCFDCLKNCKVGAIKYKFVGLHCSKGIATTSSKSRNDEKTTCNNERATNENGSAISDRHCEGATATAAISNRHCERATATAVISNRHCEGASATAAISNRHCEGASATAVISDHKDQSSYDEGRRNFLTTSAVVIGAGIVSQAQNKHLDGGLAQLVDKQSPKRTERIVPPGAMSVKNFYSHCTACQLCVDNCPNSVLKPSSDLEHFLQPYMTYEEEYCRPECNICSTLCPSGAIRPIEKDEKLTIKIGLAEVNTGLCLAVNGEAACGNCVRHCPTGALRMITIEGKRTPVVNDNLCVGCGSCEHLCPARPISAITVNGLSTHIYE